MNYVLQVLYGVDREQYLRSLYALSECIKEGRAFSGLSVHTGFWY